MYLEYSENTIDRDKLMNSINFMTQMWSFDERIKMQTFCLEDRRRVDKSLIKSPLKCIRK